MGAALMTTTAVWLGSWLHGASGSDDLLEAMAGAAPDAPAVGSLRGAAPAPLPDLLRAIRLSGADGSWLLLPSPGRTIGWPPGVQGTPVPAVLLSGGDRGVGLLRHSAAGWRWDPSGPASLTALQAGMLTARSGARALASAVTAAAERLERLGLDRAATRSAPRAWEGALGRLPRGLDTQVEALLVRLATLHDALDLALAEQGAAVTAGEARARAAELQAVIGQVQDVIAGVVGGLNAPSPTAHERDARPTTSVERRA
jgi:hypothetical protein